MVASLLRRRQARGLAGGAVGMAHREAGWVPEKMGLARVLLTAGEDMVDLEEDEWATIAEVEGSHLENGGEERYPVAHPEAEVTEGEEDVEGHIDFSRGIYQGNKIKSIYF